MDEQYIEMGLDPGVEYLRDVAEGFAQLGRRVEDEGGHDPFQAITSVACERVQGAVGASITTLRYGEFLTVAATDERVRRADAIQYELGSGPCLDAIVTSTMYSPCDLRTDDRWPAYGRRVADELGLHSMLSYRMLLPSTGTVAGLNLYAEAQGAFTERDTMIGLLLATHGALVATAAFYDRHVQNLERALRSNRGIGTAMGVLMANHKVTEDQAFDLLRITSQNTNRKIVDLAHEVVQTGALDVTPHQRPLVAVSPPDSLTSRPLT